MQVELEKGLLGCVLRQPSVESDEGQASYQTGAMTIDEGLKTCWQLLLPAESFPVLLADRIYGCTVVRGSSPCRFASSTE